MATYGYANAVERVKSMVKRGGRERDASPELRGIAPVLYTGGAA